MPKQRVTPKTRSSKSRQKNSNSRQEAVFEAVVRDIASDGRAVVAHPDGRAFFVGGAWLGEHITVTPTGRKGDVGFGVVREVLQASPDRREAPCSHHGVGTGTGAGGNAANCGGCPWMFVGYSAQLTVKATRVFELVSRLLESAPLKGRKNDPVDAERLVRPIHAAASEFGYRNRAQFKTDGQQLGYMASGSNQLVDVSDCLVLNETNREQLGRLRSELPNREWRSDRRNGIYWHTLDIDDQLPEARLDGRLPFRQGNSEQNTFMQTWLSQQIARIDAAQPVLELFAGSGNFTALLAQHFDGVLAVEGDGASIDALGRLADQGVATQACDLFAQEQVAALVATAKDSKVLVLDPPRDGLRIREPLVKGLKKLETIIYVSCDPATWARDCRDFMAAGFELEQVQPVDQFPQTPHIEILSVLRRSAGR